jgi:uncharacterized membrane protein
MNEIMFYFEWLHLSKETFRILAMIAAHNGKYRGTLTAMCHFLSISVQSNNRNSIKSGIKKLKYDKYIKCKKTGRTYHLTIIPKKEPISIDGSFAQSIISHDYSSEQRVAWEQVLKVYCYVCHNKAELTTNEKIAESLAMSTTTVVSAKNVLDKEYGALNSQKVSQKVGGGFRYLGQELQIGAWWTPPKK